MKPPQIEVWLMKIMHCWNKSWIDDCPMPRCPNAQSPNGRAPKWQSPKGGHSNILLCFKMSYQND